MNEHQKQGLILIVLSAVIFGAFQFESTLNWIVPPAVERDNPEGPKPGTHVAMIALLGERNSGTRWTSE
jgi:hypothetical protein